jgi:tetrapyrrole methylase family protein / MazG family protein
MGHRPDPSDPATRVDVVGLGPGDLARVPPHLRAILEDGGRTVVVRTLRHPAAEQLAALRQVVACDDLYERSERFEEVYPAIAARVLDLPGRVVYAVPGSPLVGEFAVAELRGLCAERGVDLQVHPAESFLDALLAEVGIDPLRDGLQVLDAHHLPTPLVIDKPTVVAHVDIPEVLADAAARLARVVPEGTEVVVVAGLGSPGVSVVSVPLDDVDPGLAGPRTSLFLAPEPGGLVGAVRTMHRLREECPWDRAQTHQSLVKNLVEETHELTEALASLPDGGDPDWVAYAEVEDELGDVLLQVLFHAAIARQVGAFDIDDVAENLRQKLVRRHPHVFGDVEADTPEQVKRNWDRIKQEERAGDVPGSALDGVPAGMPALARAAKLQQRAAKVGFDWAEPGPVLEKVREEVEELAAVVGDPAAADELGDLLFAVVNLARHLDLDPEVALRRSNARFSRRFRAMELEGPLEGLSLAELDERWERAKRAGGDP